MTATPTALAHRFCVAPMMDWTDRHDRYFLRLMSARARLYTEMVTTGAVLHGKRDRLLGFDPSEQPLALQLGGSDPAELAECARIGADLGYDEINLNIGCPSDRVQFGRFGACLMAEPDLVARCVAAMGRALEGAGRDVPVTIKSRIGIDDQDSYEFLRGFIDRVRDGGCETFIVHARKALLSGLSPKQNREIPPLDYARVYRLKQDLPDLTIVLNGGVRTLDEAEAHLGHVDGVMIGREAYQNPYILADVDRRIFGETGTVEDRHGVIEKLMPYVERQTENGVPVKSISRHILGLFQGVSGARAWRRHLSEQAHRADATSAVIREAAAKVAAS